MAYVGGSTPLLRQLKARNDAYDPGAQQSAPTTQPPLAPGAPDYPPASTPTMPSQHPQSTPATAYYGSGQSYTTQGQAVNGGYGGGGQTDYGQVADGGARQYGVHPQAATVYTHGGYQQPQRVPTSSTAGYHYSPQTTAAPQQQVSYTQPQYQRPYQQQQAYAQQPTSPTSPVHPTYANQPAVTGAQYGNYQQYYVQQPTTAGSGQYGQGGTYAQAPSVQVPQQQQPTYSYSQAYQYSSQPQAQTSASHPTSIPATTATLSYQQPSQPPAQQPQPAYASQPAQAQAAFPGTPSALARSASVASTSSVASNKRPLPIPPPKPANFKGFRPAADGTVEPPSVTQARDASNRRTSVPVSGYPSGTPTTPAQPTPPQPPPTQAGQPQQPNWSQEYSRAQQVFPTASQLARSGAQPAPAPAPSTSALPSARNPSPGLVKERIQEGEAEADGEDIETRNVRMIMKDLELQTRSEGNRTETGHKKGPITPPKPKKPSSTTSGGSAGGRTTIKMPLIYSPDDEYDDSEPSSAIPSFSISSTTSPPKNNPSAPTPSISVGVPSISLPDEDDPTSSSSGGAGGGDSDDVPTISFSVAPPSPKASPKSSVPTITATSSTVPSRKFGVQGHGSTDEFHCAGCGKIISGRLVTAMDRRWHPDCFTCCHCGEHLEHVACYEAEGRPYCHLDYHELFSLRCFHCKTPIVDESYITLDVPSLGKRTYHELHFFCANCGDPFIDPKALVEESRISSNRRPAGQQVNVRDKLESKPFVVHKGYPYCEKCNIRLHKPKCRGCGMPIEGDVLKALGRDWHEDCFVCESCKRPFDSLSFYTRDNKPFCDNCYKAKLRSEF